jgi:hypothetical protein
MFILKSIRKTESVVLSSSHRSSAVIPTLNRNSRATSEYRQSTLAGTPSVLSPQSDSATTVSPTPPAVTSHAAAAAASDNNNNNNTSSSSSSNKAINVINGDGSDAAEDLDSYGTAVAIYEYRAQRDDEFNVSIGDHFTVRDKAEVNWWVVEKDGVTGWVPAGCLMDESTDNANQNNVISGGDGVHINGNVGSVNGSGDGAANDGKPVTAVALYDYDAAGPNEVSIKRQDVLTIHKIYQHWLLVETVDGQTGWAPSCYVSINPTAAMSNTAAVEDTANSKYLCTLLFINYITTISHRFTQWLN